MEFSIMEFFIVTGWITILISLIIILTQFNIEEHFKSKKKEEREILKIQADLEHKKLALINDLEMQKMMAQLNIEKELMRLRSEYEESRIRFEYRVADNKTFGG